MGRDQLCPLADRCSESDYGSLERCKNSYVDCEIFNRHLTEEIEKHEIPKLETLTGDIVIERLPPGRVEGAIDSGLEPYLKNWPYLIVGEGKRYKKKQNFKFGKKK